jgi:hypothetical protein
MKKEHTSALESMQKEHMFTLLKTGFILVLVSALLLAWKNCSKTFPVDATCKENLHNAWKENFELRERLRAKNELSEGPPFKNTKEEAAAKRPSKVADITYVIGFGGAGASAAVWQHPAHLLSTSQQRAISFTNDDILFSMPGEDEPRGFGSFANVRDDPIDSWFWWTREALSMSTEELKNIITATRGHSFGPTIASSITDDGREHVFTFQTQSAEETGGQDKHVSLSTVQMTALWLEKYFEKLHTLRAGDRPGTHPEERDFSTAAIFVIPAYFDDKSKRQLKMATRIAFDLLGEPKISVAFENETHFMATHSFEQEHVTGPTSTVVTVAMGRSQTTVSRVIIRPDGSTRTEDEKHLPIGLASFHNHAAEYSEWHM